jgi:arylsulfatase A-like enzyme
LAQAFWLVLLSFLILPARIHGQADTRPDLFLLSFDALRADHLGCYGYEKNTSPAIDRLSQKGVVFEQCFSVRGLTGPGLTTMATGLSTPGHGILGHEPGSVSRRLTLMPEWLGELGYHTVFFYANSMAKQVGVDLQGWDYTYFQRETDRVAAEANAFLNSRSKLNDPGKPLFCWIHFYYPHSPFMDFPPYTREFDAPEAYWGPATGTQKYLNEVWFGERTFDERDYQRVLALYDATIRRADDLMGEIIETIETRRKRNPGRPTLICFTSDHGEELADHGRFFFHARSIWKGSCHIPFILAGLDSLEPGLRISRAIAQVDVMPTLLTLMNLPIPPGVDGKYQPPSHMDDSSLSRAWGRQRVTPIWWYRNEQWTYIYHPFTEVEPYIPYPPEGVFNRMADPYEKVNLADSRAYVDVQKQLKKLLEQQRHRGTPLCYSDIQSTDQPEVGETGFHIYALEDLPGWVFVEWSPVRSVDKESFIPVKLLVYSDQPFLDLDGNILATAYDQSAVLAGSGDRADYPGMLAMQAPENATISIECYHENTPAWDHVTIGNHEAPETSFSFTIQSAEQSPIRRLP